MRRNVVALVVVVSAVVAGCSKDGDKTAPTGEPLSPAPGSTWVAVNAPVRARFSEAMDCGSVAASLTIASPVGRAQGAVACAGGEVTFTPTAELLSGNLYTVTIGTGAKDVAGNTLAAPVTWSFTTETSPPAPLGVTVQAGNGQATLSWLPAAGATAYDLYYGSALGSLRAAGTRVASVTSPHLLSNLPADPTALGFVVVARNRWGESPPSSEVTARVDLGVRWTTVSSNAPLYGVAWTGTRLVAVGKGGLVASSANAADWTYGFSGLQRDLFAVAAGPSRVVAVGAGGAITTSTDGVSWTPVASELVDDLLAVTWSAPASRFVAVGTAGRILTSPDGLVWTDRISGTVNALRAICSDGTRLVAAGDEGDVLTSSDGATWALAAWSGHHLDGIAWANGQFVASTTYRYALTSSDLETWTPIDLGGFPTAVGASASKYVVVGLGNLTAASTDGAAWTLGTPSGGGALTAVVQAGPLGFVAVDDEGAVHQSADGLAWTVRVQGWWGTPRATARFGPKLVTVGTSGGVLTSSDGVTWSAVPRATAADLAGVAASPSTLVAVGASGTILTSGDGATWTKRPVAGLTATLNGVAWTGAQFVAVGASGKIYTSPDGLAWTARTSGSTRTLYGVAASATAIVAAAFSGTVLTSGDGGATWTSRSVGSTATLYAVAWTGAQFVVAGTSGRIFTSPDGVTWTARTSGVTTTLRAVAASGSRIVVSAGASVLASSDGVTWTRHLLPVAQTIYGLAWDGTRFIANGYRGLIATSADGIAWTDRSMPAPSSLDAPHWTGSLFAAMRGGTLVTSPDGVVWTARLADAGVYGFGSRPPLTLGVGRAGTIRASTDGGLSWSDRSSGTTSALNAVLHTGARWVAVGGAGTILTSSDADTWVTQVSSTSHYLWDVDVLGTSLVAVGSANYLVPPSQAVVVVSADGGSTWTAHAPVGPVPLLLASNGAILVGVDTQTMKTLVTSTDGITWTPRFTPERGGMNDVVWTGDQFVAVGDDLVTSRDGIAWTRVPEAPLLPLWWLAAGSTRLLATGQAVLTSP